MQCTPTPAETTGGTCNLSTTLDALTPGIVREHARSVWELGQIEVLDADNEIFARQGLFIP